MIDNWLEHARIDDVISPAFADDVAARFAAKDQRIADLQKQMETYIGDVSDKTGKIAELERELAERTRERDALQETLSTVESEVAIVYDTITGGKFSKCNTVAQHVIDEVEARLAAERKAGAEDELDALVKWIDNEETVGSIAFAIEKRLAELRGEIEKGEVEV